MSSNSFVFPASLPCRFPVPFPFTLTFAFSLLRLEDSRGSTLSKSLLSLFALDSSFVYPHVSLFFDKTAPFFPTWGGGGVWLPFCFSPSWGPPLFPPPPPQCCCPPSKFTPSFFFPPLPPFPFSPLPWRFNWFSHRRPCRPRYEPPAPSK